MPLSPIGSTGSQTQLPSLVNAQDSVAKRVADCGCRALASSNPPSFIQKHSFTIIALCVVAIVAAAAFAIKFFLDRRTLLADLDAEKKKFNLAQQESQADIDQTTAQLEAAHTAKLAELTVALEKQHEEFLNNKIIELETSHAAKLKEIEQKAANARKTYTTKYAALEEEKKNLEKQRDDAFAALDNLQAQLNQLKTNYDQEHARLSMLETAEGKNTNDIRALQAQKTTLEQNYSRDILQLKEEKGKLETIHTTVLATLENQAKKLEKIAEEHKAEISSLEAENKTLAETQNQALTKLHAAKEKLKRLEAGARAVDRLQTENERLQRELRAVWDSFRSDEIIAYALGQLALRLKEPLEHPPGLPSVVEEARESIHKLVEALVTAAYQKVHDQVGDYIDTLLARKTGSNISPEKQANAHRLVPGVKERINKLGK